MEKVKNITKVLNGQKEVAVKVTYMDGTCKTFYVPNGKTANEVLSENIRNGKINLKGYDTTKRVKVEQTSKDNTSEEVIKNEKKLGQAREAADKAEKGLNKNFSDVANFKVNMKAFDESKKKAGKKVTKNNTTASNTMNEQTKSKKGGYALVAISSVLVTIGLLGAGYYIATCKGCAPVNNDTKSISTTTDNNDINNNGLVLVSTPSQLDVSKAAEDACKSSEYISKCGYTKQDIENVICLVNGLDMVNTDCRVTDPYRVEQFFNDMSTEAFEHFLATGEIKCFNYSTLYEEGTIECKALQNIEKGFDEVKTEEDGQKYFAKCYRVAQALEVDGVNVLQDTNEQFEGPFYYAVADRQMIYDMAIGHSLLIPAGYIWYDLSDEYKDIPYDTEELYQNNNDPVGVMEGLRLDFIQNELAKCDDDAKTLVKQGN